MQLRDTFSPIQIDRPHIGIFTHHHLNLMSNLPEFQWIGAPTLKATGNGEYGPKTNWVARTRAFRGQAICNGLAQSHFQSVPFRRAPGENDDLGKRWVREFRIVGKEKARSACAYVGGHNLRFLLLRKPLLNFFGSRTGRFNAGSQRELDLHQQLRSIRAGKNSFLTTAMPAPERRNAPARYQPQ